MQWCKLYGRRERCVRRELRSMRIAGRGFPKESTSHKDGDEDDEWDVGDERDTAHDSASTSPGPIIYAEGQHTHEMS